MEGLRCPQEQLPRFLYRVQYDGCNTHEVDGSLLAADITTTFDGTAILEFRSSVKNQFTRDNRSSPTPFISLFSDKKHAENWALKMRGNVHLWTIDTSSWKDPMPYFFKLSTLCRKLPVTIPDGASQHVGGAYVCLHRVPSEAIDNVMDREAIERSIDARCPAPVATKSDIASESLMKRLADLGL